MGFYKDNTVEVKFNGVTKRVSKDVAEALKKAGKLDGQKKEKTTKTEK